MICRGLGQLRIEQNNDFIVILFNLQIDIITFQFFIYISNTCNSKLVCTRCTPTSLFHCCCVYIFIGGNTPKPLSITLYRILKRFRFSLCFVILKALWVCLECGECRIVNVLVSQLVHKMIEWDACIWASKINGRRGANHLNRNGQSDHNINKIEWLASLSFFIQIRMKKDAFPTHATSQMVQEQPHAELPHSIQEDLSPHGLGEQNLRLIDSELQPYCLSEIIRNYVKQQYVIHPHFLIGTPVSQSNRAKLRCWMHQVACEAKMDRSIVATANYLVDMYFNGGGNVQMNNFQALGAASLLLTNKTLSNNVVIAVDPNLYSKKVLNSFEESICRACQFRINPITHVHLLDELIHLWNRFASNHSDMWKYYCTEKDNKQGSRCFSPRQIYELLDTIFLVVKSLQYSILDICLHAFTHFLFLDYETVSHLPKPIEDEVIINFWSNPQDQPLMASSFQSIVQHYLDFVAHQCGVQSNLYERLAESREVNSYVSGFATLLFEKSSKRKIMTSGLVETTSQSFNSESWRVGKKLMQIKKNNRKESIETFIG